MIAIGHMIFFMLHFSAIVFAGVFLFVTIPLHLIWITIILGLDGF